MTGCANVITCPICADDVACNRDEHHKGFHRAQDHTWEMYGAHVEILCEAIQ